MCVTPFRVLLIGGGTGGADTVRLALTGTQEGEYTVLRVQTLNDALQHLRRHCPDLVLLAIPGPVDVVTASVTQLAATAPSIPIVVVGAESGPAIARHVIDAGARDYLVSTQLTAYWVRHALSQHITRKRAEDAAAAEAKQLEVALDAMGDALFLTETSGRITYLNTPAETLTGWRRAEATGRVLGQVLQMVDAATREAAPDDIPLGLLKGDPAPLLPDCLVVRRDASESLVTRSVVSVRDHRGEVTGSVIVLRDMRVARTMSTSLYRLATHDPLTDLPNRLLLGERIGRALVLARRHRRQLAVLMLDLDHFKTINDTLGHPLGDEILKSVSRGLTSCVRSSDTVSRQGGDEFVVVLSELEHRDDAGTGAQKIIGCLTQPHHVAGHTLQLTVSIGISLYPDDGEDAETLIKRADLALYDAKEHGRDTYRYFAPDLGARALERQRIEADLHRAVSAREFALLYQPKISLRTGAVVGAEALIRWRHPSRGLIEPAQFLRISEECGLIQPMGRWVVEEACQQARAWQVAGLPAVPVGVNISAVEFRSEAFLPHIRDTLAATSLDPHHLEIELAERVLTGPIDVTMAVLQGLKDLGVQVAIDDFGMGWSGLNYLRRFPVDVLKVDQSFVHAVATDAKAAVIVAAVIAMGRSLNQRVVAEGVETPEQLAFLQSHDCAEGQGFFFSPPLAPPQFAALLQGS